MSGIPSWARVGAKVVCVDNYWPDDIWYGTETLPSLDTPYTIRAVLQHSSGAYGLLLVEIKNPALIYEDGAREAFFHIKRFAPLISQADDLAAHFDQLLQVPHRIEEKA